MTIHRVPQQRQHGRSGSNWGRLLLVVLIVLLIVVASLLLWQIYDKFADAPLPTPASAATIPAVAAPPQTQIYPGAGQPGTLITVWGRGWQPEEKVLICLDDLGDEADPFVLTEATVNPSGEFTTSFVFPAAMQWHSLPDIPVVVESMAGPEKASTVFKLLSDTPTPTPLPPTATAVPPTPTPSCTYAARFVTDVTIPDDTAILPGVGFIKTWRMRNSGNCAWPAGTQWAFVGGSQMSGPGAVPAPAANSGDTADLSVYLIAPTAPGTYVGYWMLNLPGVSWVTPRAYVRIVVPMPTAAPLPTATPRPPTATPVPITPMPVIYNWRGEYYNNASLLYDPVLVRDDTAVNFTWDNNAPAAVLPADNFSVRWSRSLYFEGGSYTFYAHSDDGVRLWLDNQLLIDQWRSAAGQTYTADKTVTSGNHTVRVEYYEAFGVAQIQVWWQQNAYYPNWYGEYWANPNLSGAPALVRNDPEIDFNWEFGAPASGLPIEEFSARWTQTVNFAADRYRLNVRADDGVRVYLDGNLVIDEWHLSDGKRTYQKELDLSGLHTLVVEYYDQMIAAEVRFWYERLGDE